MLQATITAGPQQPAAAISSKTLSIPLADNPAITLPESELATVTTYLCASPCSEAIDFYVRAFGAVENYRLPNPDGRLGHAEITIGDTVLMLSDEWEQGKVYSPLRFDGHTVSLSLSVPDADATYAHAIELGATPDRPPKDEPFGRSAWLVDPFGHHWNICTPNPDFDPSKM